MNRRTVFNAVVGVCATMFIPLRKSRAGSDCNSVIQKVEPFDAILRLGRQQLRHTRQAGLKPVAMRLGKRERRIIHRDCEFANPVNFAGVPIQWTDNECEIAVTTDIAAESKGDITFIAGDLNAAGGLSEENTG